MRRRRALNAMSVSPPAEDHIRRQAAPISPDFDLCLAYASRALMIFRDARNAPPQADFDAAIACFSASPVIDSTADDDFTSKPLPGHAQIAA